MNAKWGQRWTGLRLSLPKRFSIDVKILGSDNNNKLPASDGTNDQVKKLIIYTISL
jgi:hypothetical protein